MGFSLNHLFSKKHHSQGSHSITHLFKDIGHTTSKGIKTIGKGATTIYKDTRSAVAYTGKHLINDVDKVSSALSSPMLLIGVGAVVVILMMNR